MIRKSHALLFAGLLAAGGALVATSAAAQTAGPDGIARHGFQPVVRPPADDQTKKPPAPAALPGAQTDSSTVIPSDRPPGDMEPTAALFDAINRGDITAARDAINRGAHLEGRNVLDMTPLDLSIDLGRNDITFLLLSLRGVGAAPATATAAAGPDKPAATGKAHAAAQPRPARVKPQAVAARPAPARQEAEPVRQYASDPGTPSPQAGFLGFGGTVQP